MKMHLGFSLSLPKPFALCTHKFVKIVKGCKIEEEEARQLRFHAAFLSITFMCSSILWLEGNLDESKFIPIGRADGPGRLADQWAIEWGILPQNIVTSLSFLCCTIQLRKDSKEG